MSRGFYDRDDDRYGRESESGYGGAYRSRDDYDDYGREGNFGRSNYGDISGRSRMSDTGYSGGGIGSRDYSSTYRTGSEYGSRSGDYGNRGGEYGSRGYGQRSQEFGGTDRESRYYGQSGRGSYGRGDFGGGFGEGYGGSSFGRGSREDRFRDENERGDEGRFGYASRGGYGSESYRSGYDAGSNRGGSYGEGQSRYGSNPGYGWGGADQDRDRGFGGGSERRYGLDREDWRSRNRDRDDRGWWDRASDEVASWFGDEEASRRRRMDEQRDRQYYGRAEHRGRGPKNYRRTDSRIQEDINDRLSDHPYIDATEIDVIVTNGEVVLSGTVNDRQDKRLAEDIAESISGVNNVENRIRVNRGTSGSSTGTTGIGTSTTTGTDAMGTAAASNRTGAELSSGATGGTTGTTTDTGTTGGTTGTTGGTTGDTETGTGSRSRARGTTS